MSLGACELFGSALLASATEQRAIGDPQATAGALLGPWQEVSNDQVSLCVEIADYVRAYGRAR